MDKKYLNNERTQELINMIKEQYLSKDEIPYMASRIQTNVVTHSINGNSSVRAKVDFTRPFSDDNYITIWESDKLQIECAITEKTNEGFVAVISNYNSSDLDVTAKFTSFKLFEMTTIDDLETKYSDCIRVVSELSSDMIGLKDKTVVLYRGDDTYTYSPTTLTSTDNPSELGVYESDGTEYILSADTTYDSAKTYYTREIEYKSFGTYQYDETEDKWVLKSAKNDDVVQIVLDDELDATSENAVQNKVVTEAINANKEAIEVLNGTGEGSVKNTVADAISDSNHLTKEIATQSQIEGYIANPTTADFNKIYLLKDDTITGKDKYFEYQRIGDETASTFEMTGDTSTDLSDYTKTEDLASVALSGSYEDLTNKPTFTAITKAQVDELWK